MHTVRNIPSSFYRVYALVVLTFLLTGARHHQDSEEPVAQWKFTTFPTGLKEDVLEPGDLIDLVFTATLDKEWLLYSSDFKADIGPQPTTFEFMPDDTFELVGGVQPVSPKWKQDKTWDVKVSYFTPKAEFRQRVRLLKADYGIRGVIQGQYCSEKKGLCVPFQQRFGFSVP
ncbi:hypothetical protein IC229_33380 [Spirosoma sp. BT702]|uniref:Thiol:disulfide interchange protein DsbD N-terminal domain-containing protein n=1 Tax=Spirosoma profusum TaxID=2771354 RepID=A0A927GAV3_9BACT|nr:protein-disulfide reductase DsbD domain-containing protein [Spirosoma profusum]MBD2705549.1 hypothetical protein [Spirosoma profusum]